MCLSSSLIGVLVFLRRRSLLGEALSHAAYPGVALFALIASAFTPFSETLLGFGALFGALCTALLGLFMIDKLEKKLRISADSALCFVLALFFGAGVFLSSLMQQSHPLWYKQMTLFLYGQAATMMDSHILLYALFSLVIIIVLTLFYRPLQLLHFDRAYSTVLGLPVRSLDALVLLALAVAIVIGMRSVGVVLMSAMLIAPAAAARQLVRGLFTFFCLSGIFGMLSGFLGTYLSVQVPVWVHQPKLPLPTGPMIVLIATGFCLLSLLCSPRRGLVTRSLRIWRFKWRSEQENFLKQLYKKAGPITTQKLAASHSISQIKTLWLIWRMHRRGLVLKTKDGFALTPQGQKQAVKLIRLHRLWEAYLVYMGQGVEKVHHSAEEMEHVLTRDIEKELEELLRHPEKDPHQQPIPKGDL